MRVRRLLGIALLTAAYLLLALTNLGARRAPMTSWQPTAAGQAFVLDLGRSHAIARVCFFFGVGKNVWEIALSDDGSTWRPLQAFRQASGSVFRWNVRTVSGSARFVRVTAAAPGGAVHEVVAVAPGDDRPISVSAVSAVAGAVPPATGVAAVADEQETFPRRLDAASGTYFDEVYFARTAFEHLHGLPPYELSHPPLGKIFIAAGIALLGLSPFAWRIVPALAGAAMLPLTWALGRRLTGRSDIGLLAAALLACDFLHFAHSRMASVDVFVAALTLLAFLFMARYTGVGDAGEDGVASPGWLLLSGLCFGAAVACKWSAVFGGLGLAALYFAWMWRRRRRQPAAAVRPLAASLAWAALAFGAVPALVYLLSYMPFVRVAGPGYELRDILPLQRAMLAYHSEVAGDDPDASRWWEWPLIRKPVTYAISPPDLPAGKVAIIVGMGNPAIWWAGIAAVGLAVVLRRRRRDAALDVALLGLASLYLPWMLVSRHTFLYHFFPAVPFLVLVIAIVLAELDERGWLGWRWAWGYAAVAAALFAAFYPILSGTAVSRAYVGTFLRWFSSWSFPI